MIKPSLNSLPKRRRIFRPITFCTPSSGYTLLEIMVVMGILAAVLAIGAGKLFKSSDAMRAQIRKFAVMTREVRNIARLTSSTMRIAIKIDDEKGHQYWVESASGNVTLLSEDKQKELDQMSAIAREDEKPKDEFAQDTRVMKKPENLPRGLFFESVEINGKEAPITSGMAYIHFFPQGLTQEAAIHLTDRKTLNWTITINPLTGRADVFERKLTLKELHAQ
jgi:general secretion pathway protein H